MGGITKEQWEELNSPIDREILWEYMRLSPKQTNLPYDIFVDDGGEYKNNNHELWVLIDDGENLIPMTISEQPILKRLLRKSIDTEPLKHFIRNNQKRLEGLADGRTIHELFFHGLVPYDEISDNIDIHFNKDNFIRYTRIDNIFKQLYDYFRDKKNLNGKPNVFKFGEDFYYKTYWFRNFEENECPWRWLYTDENGVEYDEEQTFRLMEPYFTDNVE